MDTARTYTWVAGPASAGAAARSYARGNLRRRRWPIAGLWLATGMLMWRSLEDGLPPLARALWALAYAGVLVACALAIGLVVGHLLMRRRFGSRLAPGTELTSRFTPSTVELCGPLARHELSYDGLTHVDRVDGWVHLRQLGSPVTLVWPGELFPDADLRRMQAVIAARAT